jgi:glycerol uptake facilitator-like aquaporin
MASAVGHISGGHFNPAVTLGFLVTRRIDSLLAGYYLGPALGAVAAALAYEWLYLRPVSPDVVGPPESGVEEPAPGRAATE